MCGYKFRVGHQDRPTPNHIRYFNPTIHAAVSTEVSSRPLSVLIAETGHLCALLCAFLHVPFEIVVGSSFSIE